MNILLTPPFFNSLLKNFPFIQFRNLKLIKFIMGIPWEVIVIVETKSLRSLSPLIFHIYMNFTNNPVTTDPKGETLRLKVNIKSNTLATQLFHLIMEFIFILESILTRLRLKKTQYNYDTKF
jgi:hypothetical protein